MRALGLDTSAIETDALVTFVLEGALAGLGAEAAQCLVVDATTPPNQADCHVATAITGLAVDAGGRLEGTISVRRRLTTSDGEVDCADPGPGRACAIVARVEEDPPLVGMAIVDVTGADDPSLSSSSSGAGTIRLQADGFRPGQDLTVRQCVAGDNGSVDPLTCGLAPRDTISADTSGAIDVEVPLLRWVPGPDGPVDCGSADCVIQIRDPEGPDRRTVEIADGLVEARGGPPPPAELTVVPMDNPVEGSPLSFRLSSLPELPHLVAVRQCGARVGTDRGVDPEGADRCNLQVAAEVDGGEAEVTVALADRVWGNGQTRRREAIDCREEACVVEVDTPFSTHTIDLPLVGGEPAATVRAEGTPTEVILTGSGFLPSDVVSTHDCWRVGSSPFRCIKGSNDTADAAGTVDIEHRADPEGCPDEADDCFLAITSSRSLGAYRRVEIVAR